MRKESKLTLNIILPLFFSFVVLILALFFNNKSNAASQTSVNFQPRLAEGTKLAAGVPSNPATLSTSGSAAGTSEDNGCADISPFLVESQLYCGNKEQQGQVSIVRTVLDANTATAASTGASYLSSISLDQLALCGAYLINDLFKDIPAGAKDAMFGGSFSEAVAAADPELCSVIGTSDFRTATGRGSLMSITKTAFDTTASDPLPLDLAYYAKDLAQRMPIIKDTAFAEATYSGTIGMGFTLNLWKATRNLAYAIMAVIMLIIGIMIIMRKEIGRAYITVQTAIPRVVISLFLITFSYPIGAIMSSMIQYLLAVVAGLFFSDLFSGSIPGFSNISTFITFRVPIMFAVIFMFVLGPAGLMAVLFGIVFLAVLVLAVLAAVIKMIIVYLKITLEIIFAPLQFAIAAIPGQEDLIKNWFKRMASLVLSVPAIMFFIILSFYILIKPLSDPLGTFGSMVNTSGPVSFFLSLGSAYVSSIFTIVMLPVMSIMCLFFSLKADKKIEELIMGPPTKKR